MRSTGEATRPTARIEIELVVPAGNNPGLLATVLRAVAGRQVNVLAYCTAFDVDHFTIMLVTDAALVAKTALAKAGWKCFAHAVVLVRAADRPGAPAALVHQLCEAGIAIRYAYDAVLHPPERCVVFSTADDQRALQVLGATDLVHTASR